MRLTSSRPFRLLRGEGFTLIELLVVILIIGILIAVSAPSFLGQTQKAHDSESQQYLTIAYKAAAAYAVDGNGAPGHVQGNFDGFDGTVLHAMEPGLTGDVVAGGCPLAATTDPKHITIDTASGGTLTICNDPNHRVWTLTVVNHQLQPFGPPANVPVPSSGGGGSTGLPTSLTSFSNSDGMIQGAPRLSPDGKYVAWAASGGSPMNLVVAPADGSGSQHLIASNVQATGPSDYKAFLDNNHILYATAAGIYEANADGSGSPSLLVNIPNPDLVDAASGVVLYGDSGHDLWAYHVSSSTSVQLTHADAEGIAGTSFVGCDDVQQGGALSPDGLTAAFTRSCWDSSFASVGKEIFTVSTAGGTPTRRTFTGTTSGNYENSGPHWSPDGSQIGFSHLDNVVTGLSQAAIIPATATSSANETDLTSVSDDSYVDGWVDSSHLLIESDHGDTVNFNYNIYSYAISGGVYTLLAGPVGTNYSQASANVDGGDFAALHVDSSPYNVVTGPTAP